MSRVTGVFHDRDALLGAIEAAHSRRLPIETAFMPAYDAEIIDAVGVPRSRAGSIALGAGILGGAAGLVFPAWAVEQWPNVTMSGKPLLSWPTFLIISFEMALLCAALAAALAFGIGLWRGRQPAGRAVTDSFALLIVCPPDREREAAELMRARGASRCEHG